MVWNPGEKKKKIEASWKMFLLEKSGQPDDSWNLSDADPLQSYIAALQQFSLEGSVIQSQVNCLSLRGSKNPSSSSFGRSHEGTSWTLSLPSLLRTTLLRNGGFQRPAELDDWTHLSSVWRPSRVSVPFPPCHHWPTGSSNRRLWKEERLFFHCKKKWRQLL